METLRPHDEASKPLHTHIRTIRGGRHLVKPAEPTPDSRKTTPVTLSSHRWRSQGDKRTIMVPYEPSERILRYLVDMRETLTMALAHGYALAKTTPRQEIPNPIALRRNVKPWFDSRYGDYAKHHVNPVCRTTVALPKSYRKRHGKLALPQVRRLTMRIDSELFRVTANGDGTVTVRVTLKPFNYEYITFTPSHKKWSEYSNAATGVSEVILMEGGLFLIFVVGVDGGGKPLGRRLSGLDLNFHTIDSTALSGGRLEPPRTEPLKRIVQIQKAFSRRRRRLQLHVRNPQKRAVKLRETRGRQRNRVRDGLHQLSTRIVKDNPDTSFIFEDLKGVRRNVGERQRRSAGRRLRTYLGRWPYRMLQGMVEYKSRCRTLYVSPRGTSSECPVCGGVLEHPAWAVSRCRSCGVDYDRDRLASLAILRRGLRLCGQPFAVSADASWRPLRNEYLYAPRESKAGRAGWTKQAANAPNGNVVNFHESTHF